jgi:hypothetical protein
MRWKVFENGSIRYDSTIAPQQVRAAMLRIFLLREASISAESDKLDFEDEPEYPYPDEKLIANYDMSIG